jgi:hypothetical protein
MSTRPPLSPETRALLEREREVPALPAAQRARAMARARASLTAGAATPPFPETATAHRRPRWRAAAAAALLASAAVGAAAYELGTRLRHRAPSAPLAPAAPVVAAAPVAPTAPALEPALPTPDPEPAATSAGPALSRAEAARAELRLLRQARAAVARGDFTAALVPIGEHARRFKNGRLAEEREALRVKSLAGLGRTQEARRAAAAFRARFPRSVLLPAVGRMPAASP